MVKFQKRRIKKQYKKNIEYSYEKYLLEFPSKLNSKIEPYKTKSFDGIDITLEDTPSQEFLSIRLVRNKNPEETEKKETN